MWTIVFSSTLLSANVLEEHTASIFRTDVRSVGVDVLHRVKRMIIPEGLASHNHGMWRGDGDLIFILFFSRPVVRKSPFQGTREARGQKHSVTAYATLTA
jgi:hypothetical protein